MSAMALKRTAEQWRGCDPKAMAVMSEAAVMYALQDAKADVLAMHVALDIVTQQRDELLQAARGALAAWDKYYQSMPRDAEDEEFREMQALRAAISKATGVQA